MHGNVAHSDNYQGLIDLWHSDYDFGKFKSTLRMEKRPFLLYREKWKNHLSVKKKHKFSKFEPKFKK